jgi:hypothetical protein
MRTMPSIGDYKSRASGMAVQLTVALVLVMLEEVKPVGVPQLAVVVSDAGSLYEPDPYEQTV